MISVHIFQITDFYLVIIVFLIAVGNLDLKIEFQKGDKLFLHEQKGMSCKYTMEQIKYLCKSASLGIDDYWTNEHVACVLLHRMK